jgi:hypothetical protein
VVALGEDEDEKLPAQALVTAFVAALGRDGRRKSLWRGDDAASPRQVSVRGEWVEVKLPPLEVAVKGGARLILTAGDRVWDGRLRP